MVSYIKVVLYFISIRYVTLKKSVQNYFFGTFYYLVINENSKIPDFYTLEVFLKVSSAKKN